MDIRRRMPRRCYTYAVTQAMTFHAFACINNREKSRPRDSFLDLLPRASCSFRASNCTGQPRSRIGAMHHGLQLISSFLRKADDDGRAMNRAAARRNDVALITNIGGVIKSGEWKDTGKIRKANF